MVQKAENKSKIQRVAAVAAAARTLASLGSSEQEFVGSVAVLADLGERGALPLHVEREGKPDPRWTIAAEEVPAALARLEAGGLVHRHAAGWELTNAGRRAWIAVRGLT